MKMVKSLLLGSLVSFGCGHCEQRDLPVEGRKAVEYVKIYAASTGAGLL